MPRVFTIFLTCEVEHTSKTCSKVSSKAFILFQRHGNLDGWMPLAEVASFGLRSEIKKQWLSFTSK
jgi:hypothetical protein